MFLASKCCDWPAMHIANSIVKHHNRLRIMMHADYHESQQVYNYGFDLASSI